MYRAMPKLMPSYLVSKKLDTGQKQVLTRPHATSELILISAGIIDIGPSLVRSIGCRIIKSHWQKNVRIRLCREGVGSEVTRRDEL